MQKELDENGYKYEIQTVNNVTKLIVNYNNDKSVGKFNAKIYKMLKMILI